MDSENKTIAASDDSQNLGKLNSKLQTADEPLNLLTSEEIPFEDSFVCSDITSKSLAVSTLDGDPIDETDPLMIGNDENDVKIQEAVEIASEEDNSESQESDDDDLRENVNSDSESDESASNNTVNDSKRESDEDDSSCQSDEIVSPNQEKTNEDFVVECDSTSGLELVEIEVSPAVQIKNNVFVRKSQDKPQTSGQLQYGENNDNTKTKESVEKKTTEPAYLDIDWKLIVPPKVVLQKTKLLTDLTLNLQNKCQLNKDISTSQTSNITNTNLPSSDVPAKLFHGSQTNSPVSGGPKTQQMPCKSNTITKTAESCETHNVTADTSNKTNSLKSASICLSKTPVSKILKHNEKQSEVPKKTYTHQSCVNNSKPIKNADQSSVSKPKQVDNGNILNVSIPRMTENANKPNTSNSKQFENANKPYTSNSKQFENANKPYTSNSKQVENANKPCTSNSKQVENANKSDTNNSKQVENANKPDTNNSKQIENTNKQDASNSKQIENANKPSTSNSKLIENTNQSSISDSNQVDIRSDVDDDCVMIENQTELVVLSDNDENEGIESNNVGMSVLPQNSLLVAAQSRETDGSEELGFFRRCYFCKELAPTFIRLGIFKCDRCRTNSNPDIKPEINIKTYSKTKQNQVKRFKCPVCTMSFMREQTLNLHIQMHQAELKALGKKPMPPQFKCRKCPFVTEFKRIFILHQVLTCCPFKKNEKTHVWEKNDPSVTKPVTEQAGQLNIQILNVVSQDPATNNVSPSNNTSCVFTTPANNNLDVHISKVTSQSISSISENVVLKEPFPSVSSNAGQRPLATLKVIPNNPQSSNALAGQSVTSCGPSSSQSQTDNLYDDYPPPMQVNRVYELDSDFKKRENCGIFFTYFNSFERWPKQYEFTMRNIDVSLYVKYYNKQWCKNKNYKMGKIVRPTFVRLKRLNKNSTIDLLTKYKLTCHMNVWNAISNKNNYHRWTPSFNQLPKPTPTLNNPPPVSSANEADVNENAPTYPYTVSKSKAIIYPKTVNNKESNQTIEIEVPPLHPLPNFITPPNVDYVEQTRENFCLISNVVSMAPKGTTETLSKIPQINITLPKTSPVMPRLRPITPPSLTPSQSTVICLDDDETNKIPNFNSSYVNFVQNNATSSGLNTKVSRSKKPKEIVNSPGVPASVKSIDSAQNLPKNLVFVKSPIKLTPLKNKPIVLKCKDFSKMTADNVVKGDFPSANNNQKLDNIPNNQTFPHNANMHLVQDQSLNENMAALQQLQGVSGNTIFLGGNQMLFGHSLQASGNIHPGGLVHIGNLNHSGGLVQVNNPQGLNQTENPIHLIQNMMPYDNNQKQGNVMQMGNIQNMMPYDNQKQGNLMHMGNIQLTTGNNTFPVHDLNNICISNVQGNTFQHSSQKFINSPNNMMQISNVTGGAAPSNKPPQFGNAAAIQGGNSGILISDIHNAGQSDATELANLISQNPSLAAALCKALKPIIENSQNANNMSGTNNQELYAKPVVQNFVNRSVLMQPLVNPPKKPVNRKRKQNISQPLVNSAKNPSEQWFEVSIEPEEPSTAQSKPKQARKKVTQETSLASHNILNYSFTDSNQLNTDNFVLPSNSVPNETIPDPRYCQKCNIMFPNITEAQDHDIMQHIKFDL